MSIVIFGCTNETEDIDNENVSITNNLGEIPEDHQVYKVFDYNDLLNLHKTSLKNEANTHYFTNLKHICLFKIFENPSFFEESSSEERLYLIKKLVDMDNALPNIEHFYEVIVFMLEHDEVEISKADNFIEIFEKKNKTALDNSSMKDELKDKKLEAFKEGKFQINLFYRTKRYLDFKDSSK